MPGCAFGLDPRLDLPTIQPAPMESLLAAMNNSEAKEAVDQVLTSSGVSSLASHRCCVRQPTPRNARGHMRFVLRGLLCMGLFWQKVSLP
jgi:hypothetical protein